MSVDSFAKIDMSLDDIIKLNKKEKKADAAKKKNPTGGKKLTVAQKKRAEALKAKARSAQMKKLKSQKAKGGKPSSKTNAAQRGNNARKKKFGMTSGGYVNAAIQGQMSKRSTPRKNSYSVPKQTQQAAVQRGKTSRGVQSRLGIRITNAQKGQRNRRQQMQNQNRPGLASTRGTGRQRRGNGFKGFRGQGSRRSNTAQRNITQAAQNRKYNQQPRLRQRQQMRGRGRMQQQKTARNSTNRGSTTSYTGRSVTLY